MNLAPIVLFCYNRLDSLRQTVQALKTNELAKESKLFIFSDGPKNELERSQIQAVREYIHALDGFHSIEIRESEGNRGLANSVIAGVTEIVNRYGKVIVIEDDLVTSPYFLTWMNHALDSYMENDRVGAVVGFSPLNGDSRLPDTFFLKTSHCWGWATWKRAWSCFNSDTLALLDRFSTNAQKKEFDLGGSYFFYKMLEMQRDGKVDSWFVRWNASLFFAGKYTVYPKYNLVSNIGINSGTHYSNDSKCTIIPLSNEVPVLQENLQVIENKRAYKLYRKYYRSLYRKFDFISFIRTLPRRVLLFVCPYGMIKLYFRFFRKTEIRIVQTIVDK